MLKYVLYLVYINILYNYYNVILYMPNIRLSIVKEKKTALHFLNTQR